MFTSVDIGYFIVFASLDEVYVIVFASLYAGYFIVFASLAVECIIVLLFFLPPIMALHPMTKPAISVAIFTMLTSVLRMTQNIYPTCRVQFSADIYH